VSAGQRRGRWSGVPIEDRQALRRGELIARAATVAMGGAASFAFAPMSGAQMRRMAIPGTLSLARRVGAAVREARRVHANPVTAACAATGGQEIFRGKVTDVQRRLVAGFARGELLLDGSGDSRGSALRIAFQNENLIAWRDGEVAATAPDLAGGSYAGPDGFLEGRGHPRLVEPSAAARDEAVAHRLWEVSERLTGVVYDFGAV